MSAQAGISKQAVGDWRHEMPQIATSQCVSSPTVTEQQWQYCALSGLDWHQIFWRSVPIWTDWCAVQSRAKASLPIVSLFRGNFQGYPLNFDCRSLPKRQMPKAGSHAQKHFPKPGTGNLAASIREAGGHYAGNCCKLWIFRSLILKFRLALGYFVWCPLQSGRSLLRQRLNGIEGSALHSGIAPTNTGRLRLPMRGWASPRSASKAV